MAWNAPRTYIAGEVHSAATLNTDHRDNLIALRGGGIAVSGQGTNHFLFASSPTQIGTLAAVAKKYPRLNPAGTAWEMNIPTTGKHELFLPASGFASFNNVAAVTRYQINNLLLYGLPFGATAQEFAAIAYPMPKAWALGNVTAQFYWLNTAGGSGGVTWGFLAAAFSDDDPATSALGTAVHVTDQALVANDVAISPESGAHTIGASPQDNDLIVFWVYRLPTDAGDTYASPAIFLGVKIRFVTDEETDD